MSVSMSFISYRLQQVLVYLCPSSSVVSLKVGMSRSLLPTSRKTVVYECDLGLSEN